MEKIGDQMINSIKRNKREEIGHQDLESKERDG
jgi:hypothetical protein